MAENVDPSSVAPSLECTARQGAPILGTGSPDEQFECLSSKVSCTSPVEDVGKVSKELLVSSLQDAPSSSSSAQPQQDSMASVVRGQTVSKCDPRRGYNGHQCEEQSTVTNLFKTDLQDISAFATRRVASIQRMAESLRSMELKMEDELDQASRDVASTEEKLVDLIRRRAVALQEELTQAKEDARRCFAEALREAEKSKEDAAKVLASSRDLLAGEDDSPAEAAARAPGLKQQLLQQRQDPLPDVCWSMEVAESKPGRKPATSLCGDVELKFLVSEAERETVLEECDGTLGSPVQVTILDYDGEYAICGVAVVHGSLICVTHRTEEHVWVYRDQQMTKKIKVPELDGAQEMVAMDADEGTLAICDDTKRMVHMVTLSADAELVDSEIRNVPFVPNCLGVNNSKHLVLYENKSRTCVTMTRYGVVVREVRLDVPESEAGVYSIVPTLSGYAVCGYTSKNIFFSDSKGGSLQASGGCGDPWHAVTTSWGHVLVADHVSDVKIFTEAGGYLGRLGDDDGRGLSPHFLCLVESERLLYVGCGQPSKMEVRAYRFSAPCLPSLPVRSCEKRLQMSLTLPRF